MNPSDNPRRRVLLVEDSEDVRETTIEFINEVGYDVDAVESAEAALVALDGGGHYDIVFTDVSLPGMNGIDLVKRMREQKRPQRVVIASGYGADLNRHGLGDGVEVLSKPYDLTTLERTLNKLVDGS